MAATDAETGPITWWRLFLWPPLAIATLLLALQQAVFVWMSLHRNLGMGLISKTLTAANYLRILTDPFYLGSLWLTFWLSLLATAIGLTLAFPTAYVLARSRSPWVSAAIVVLLVTALVSVVIKVLGLSLVLGQEAVVNQLMRALGLVSVGPRLLGNATGVIIGLVQYTLPFLVMVLVSVIQTIPESLEEAAELQGASRFTIFRRILLPLARPGAIAGGLIAFNLNMGAFTSALLLGGGNVLTLPVVIQRKIMLDVDYPLAASLSTLLLALVFLFNLLTALLLQRRGPGAGAPA